MSFTERREPVITYCAGAIESLLCRVHEHSGLSFGNPRVTAGVSRDTAFYCLLPFFVVDCLLPFFVVERIEVLEVPV
jgi:hypothetical protein